MSTILRKAVTRIILDVASPDVQKAVSVTQGDVNRKFEITLVDGGRPFPLQPKWTAALVGIKPDGKNLFNSCVVDETGKIVYDFAGGEEIATAAGGYAIYFEIYDEVGDTLASPSIWLTVIPFPSRDMASEDQYTAAREIIRRINEAEGHIETLEERMDEKDEQVEDIVGRLNEKDEQVEDIVERLDEKDEQVEDIVGRLDEKDEQVEELQSKMTRVSLVTIPKSTWKDSTPIEAQIKLPDVVGNSVAFLVPADDTTRMTASAAGLTPTVSTLDKEGDTIFVSRGEFVPAHDMNFLCFVLQGDSEEKTEPTASFVGISAGGSGGSTPIANDLETNSPTWALSAAQGVVLKGMVDTLGKNGTKVETGWYNGTGTKTLTLTFSFVPKIIFIIGRYGTDTTQKNKIFGCIFPSDGVLLNINAADTGTQLFLVHTPKPSNESISSEHPEITIDGTSVTIYNNQMDTYALNIFNAESTNTVQQYDGGYHRGYWYVAIG